MMKLKNEKCVVCVIRGFGKEDEIRCVGRKDECPKDVNLCCFDVDCLEPVEFC